jgi:hypothetical protein
MDLNSKTYKIKKIKKYVKKNELFFFFNTTKLKKKDWTKVEQNLRRLKLNYYKVFNGTTLKTVKNSIYKNFFNIVCGVVLLIKPQFKFIIIEKKLLEKETRPLFTLLSVKLNNKIYSTQQIKKLDTFSYKQNLFNLNQSLNKILKATYIFSK